MSTTTSVEKALKILQCFTKTDRSFSLLELSEQLQMPKPSVHRLCSSLLNQGFLSKDLKTNKYRLGLTLLEIASVYLQSSSVVHSINDIIGELSQLLGETVTIYRLSGMERKCLMRIESTAALRHSIDIGQTLPLYKGAAGKIILAFSSNAFLDVYTKAVNISDLFTSQHALISCLKVIKKQQYAETYGEREAYLAAVAVPLFGAENEIFGALNVSGPIERFKKSIDYQAIQTIQAYGEKLNSLIPNL